MLQTIRQNILSKLFTEGLLAFISFLLLDLPSFCKGVERPENKAELHEQNCTKAYRFR